jgi:Trk-type K+ transport system membrane component
MDRASANIAINSTRKIATMFIGRIGMLNLMIGLLRQMNHQFYEYPKENILIN